MKTPEQRAREVVDAFIWDKARIAQYPICDSDLDLLRSIIAQAIQEAHEAGENSLARRIVAGESVLGESLIFCHRSFIDKQVEDKLKESVTPPTEDEIERAAMPLYRSSIDVVNAFKAGVEFAIKKMRGE